MEAQEIFDTVAKHLAAQGGKASDARGFCQYRMDNGRKCAAGCLLTDEEYSPDLDDLGGVTRLHKAGKWPARIGNVDLVRALQTAHDGDDNRWIGDRLATVAERFALNPAILEELTFPNVWA